MRSALLVIMLLGCGRVGFDGRTDAVAVDGPSPSGPFGTPTPIAELNSTTTDDDPSLTGDLLELYYQSERSGSQLLYRSTRGSVGDPWGPPTEVSELSAGGNINNAKITPDGLTIYFSSSRAPNVGGADIWVATRPDRSSTWETPAPVTELETAENDYEPCADATRRTLYFASTRGPSQGDLWSASRATDSEPFGNVVMLTAQSSSVYDGGPWIAASGLTLYWHSDRGTDRSLYTAERVTTAGPFGAVTPMTELDSPDNEQDPWVSPDGHTVVFVSNRNTGDYDLYTATR